ncbi:unnamed protein product [Allacma fusca]|uniref:HAT C-terminal dimerisation domain-containing protein n=1 Tax=Allacma fusca TaxID=39272 RepID=A0A8J2KLF5_9HEXA|nr:unnamed protein product [Allacma fusca]
MIVLAATNACDKLNKYYPKTDGLVHILGIFLDPRLKLDWHKTAGFKDNVSSYKRTIIQVWNAYKPAQEDISKEVEMYDDLFDRQMKRARIDSRDELEKYISQHPVKSSEVPNGVLTWWKEHELDFPNLAKMARDYLEVSATDVPAKCLFSTGTDLITPKRMKMLEDTIRISMCLKAWLKFGNRRELLQKLAEAVARKFGENMQIPIK